MAPEQVGFSFSLLSALYGFAEHSMTLFSPSCQQAEQFLALFWSGGVWSPASYSTQDQPSDCRSCALPLAQLDWDGFPIRSAFRAIRIIQVAQAQAVAGRLANQLAPSDTEPNHAMADLSNGMADYEQQSPAHADGAQSGKRPSADTAAQGQGRTEEVPPTHHRQPGRAAQKRVGWHGLRHVSRRHTSAMAELACHISFSCLTWKCSIPSTAH